jgi:Protein of unknown function DUF45
MGKTVQHLKAQNGRNDPDPFLADRAAFELYQAFMVGYVRRLNEATFNVTIGGVRIGSAKYSRLAQINLKSRIITFSRFAVENVPERGRRYLVLHELAHVKEANHNDRFWGLVEQHEPSYLKVSQELEIAFRRNVKEDIRRLKQLKLTDQLTGKLSERLEEAKLLLSKRLLNYKLDSNKKPESGNRKPESGSHNNQLILPFGADGLTHNEEIAEANRIIDPSKYECEQELLDLENGLDCGEDELDDWDNDAPPGTVHGGCLE